jgi:hypothetical protein
VGACGGLNALREALVGVVQTPRAGLDGLYTHLYSLTREELAYILDTFPIVRRKDEEKYGEYRTKRMVLEGYDALKGQFG